MTQLLIDGRLVDGGAGTFPTLNPATEEIIGVARHPGGPGVVHRVDRHRPRRHAYRRANRQEGVSRTRWQVGVFVVLDDADLVRACATAAVAGRLRTGTVSVNGGVWYSADTPFGGYRQSGNGREMGLAGFEEYLQTKVIAGLIDP